MSEKILFGALDTFELLLFLSPIKHITSGIIRKNFPQIPPETIRHKLEKLAQQGFIEKKTKKGERAGDDRTEFKLTSTGANLRIRLLERGIEVLYDVLNQIVKQKTSKEFPMADKEEKIKTFLMEFSKESKKVVGQQTLKEQMGLLERLLRKVL